MLPTVIEENRLEKRLSLLTAAAKYDVSCSSSGSARGAQKGHLGSCAIAGICHSFTSDGRCISLLKLLASNKCEFDCLYCPSRKSANAERASLSEKEICETVVGLYKRNFIEGLFLSSAVEKSPNATMEKLIRTLIMLRNEYKFNGYVHVKAIPGARKDLLEKCAMFADRMSVNIELPSEKSLRLLAPQKTKDMVISPIKTLSNIYKTEQAEKGKYNARILPAGQTTQMIIGASPDSDGQIIRLTQHLYDNYLMKRVYYSAYVPVVENSLLPSVPPDLRRENRLYQADWLLRFYGFTADELIGEHESFSLDVDPKCDWALRHIDKFPVEVNTASYEMLLRVPGIGVKNAYRIVRARKHTCLTFESLKKMRVALTRAAYFITANGKYQGIGEKPDLIRLKIGGGGALTLSDGGENRVPQQLTMFGNSPSVITGEL